MSGSSANAIVKSGAGRGDALKRVLVVVALVALVACGDPSVTGVLSSGSQHNSIVTPAVTSTPRTTTTVPPTTVPPTTVPPTTVPPATTTAVVGSDAAAGTGQLFAIDVLAFISVENEHAGGYLRDLFDYPADLDADGCDTRSEVLQIDSITPAQVDIFGCTVVQGDWISPYDGLVSSNRPATPRSGCRIRRHRDRRGSRTGRARIRHRVRSQP